MTNIAKIRAALECAKSAARFCTLPRLDRETDEALAALAELEKAAAEPAGKVLIDAILWTNGRPAVDTRLYTAAPPAPVAEIREVVVDDAMARRIAETVFGQLGEGRVCADDGRKMIAAVRAELGPALGLVEIREATYATAEMSSRVANSYFGMDTPANMSDMLEVLNYWRRELGPALGLVELKEPTPEECKRIYAQFAHANTDESRGRAMFDAVRAVMWPKEGL